MVTEIIFFEVAVLVVLLGTYFSMTRIGYDKVVKKMLIMIIVIFIIEILTMPFWSNSKLDSWTYIYKDVSWILTVLWTDISFISIILVDRIWGRRHEKERFWSYFLIIGAFRFILEWVLTLAKIRTYNTSLTEIFNGTVIPVLELPFSLVIVSIIIGIFTITFYKYTSEFLFKHMTF